MMNSINYQHRLDAIRTALASASMERWGSVPRIVAVSKNVPAERINPVKDAGILSLGENRVQEVLEKYPHLDASFEIDFIGRLQSNKVKYIIDKVHMIQSLDRESLAQEIDRRAQQRGICMPVLVQVNIGRESQKGGVFEEDLERFVRYAASLPGLSVQGLMAVMPDLEDEQALRPYFVRMRGLFDMLREKSISGTDIRDLSMGMSGDYELAAQEGATIVRIGSAIFGNRQLLPNTCDLKGDMV